MISIVSLAIAAQLATIPADMQTSLDKALATEDRLIVEAVLRQVIKDNPDKKEEIKNYVLHKSAAMKTAKPEEAKVEDIKNEPADFWSDGWSGELVAGLLITSGNSEDQDFNGEFEIVKTMERWKHEFEVEFENNSSGDERSDEKYEVEIQSNYSLSAIDYVFGELEWEKDRYSGYEFRAQEVIGYGYKFYDSDEFKLSAEGALGLQQFREEGQESQNEPVQKFEADLEWAITEGLSFLQSVSTEHSDGIFFSDSESYLKTKVMEHISLQLGFEAEHRSEVPVNTDKLDTKTKFNVVYDF